MIDHLVTPATNEATDPPVSDLPPDVAAGSCSLARGSEGLVLLLEGYELARRLGRDRWDMAVEISELERGGLSRNAIRWLICRQYVRHGMEVESTSDDRRTFVLTPTSSALRFTADSCFILSEQGVSFVRGFLAVSRREEVSSRPRQLLTARSDTPTWDSLRQELRLGDQVVKRFKVRAPNQERILSAFQEEGWPACIDDPLPRRADVDPKRRLHETINSLNRSQKHRLIRFMGNGKGEGIAWELC